MLTYNTKQTAEHLGVTPKRVRELIASKRLKATQNKSFKWEVTKKCLNEYVQKGRIFRGRARNVDD